jgi:spore maturation protein SpmB
LIIKPLSVNIGKRPSSIKRQRFGGGGDLRFVDALPTALMKPLSGSGARGMMVEAMQNFGADSFVGRLAGARQGSTETTLYVVRFI